MKTNQLTSPNLGFKNVRHINNIRSSGSKYCEKHYYRLRRTGTLEIVKKERIFNIEDFNSNVTKRKNGCIDWNGTAIRGSYGSIRDKGEKHGMSKLTESDVIKIRDLHKEKVSIRKIAKIFSVTYCPIQTILANKSWKHVKQPQQYRI